jgi:hypothetical protein
MDILVIAIHEAALLLNNQSATDGHYLQVGLVGKRSNRDGIGTRVIVTAGGRKMLRERSSGASYLSAHDPRLHFGLGPAARAERVDILWPSGTRDVLLDVAADRLITVEEGSHPPSK